VADTLPHVLFDSTDESGRWRIVRVLIDPKRRENEADDGIRDLIELADGVDLMGHQRWRQLDQKGEGIANVVRLCHSLKRELLARMETDDAEG
jgi:hypothetical protein